MVSSFIELSFFSESSCGFVRIVHNRAMQRRIFMTAFLPSLALIGCGGGGGGGSTSNPTQLQASITATNGQLKGSSGNSVVGYATVGANAHAMYWTDSLGDGEADLNPAGHTSSVANKIAGNLIVGEADNLAYVWTSPSAASAVNIHPAGYTESFANGSSNGTIVGEADNHAMVWNSASATAFIDIHPTGFSESFANSMSGNLIVGCGDLSSTGAQHALIWPSKSAAAAVDIHPSSFYSSCCNAADSGLIVGSGEIASTKALHAMAWTGKTSSTAVDIHPAGYDSSCAWSTRNGLIVGYGVIGGVSHALVWTKPSAKAFVDLQSLLPTNYTQSFALDIDANKLIVGQGTIGSSGEVDGVAWSPVK